MRITLAFGISMALLTSSAFGADMGVSFEWGPTKKCFDPKSPPIKLAGVPAGTENLDIKMIDRNAIGFDHGGATMPYKGQAALPYGAFRYRGPCPPSGSHSYQFTVKALDSGGKVLATAKTSKMFP